MNCSINLELVQILVRMILLVCVSVGAYLCVYLGWRLYRDSIVSRTTGAIETLGLRLRISSGSPGIVLAAFGAYLLASVAQHRFETEESRPVAVPQSQSSFVPQAPAIAHAAAWFGEGPRALAQAGPTDQSPPSLKRQDTLMYECALYRKKTKYLAGSPIESPKALADELDNLRTVVAEATARGPKSLEAKRRALNVIAELQQLAAESAEASERFDETRSK